MLVCNAFKRGADVKRELPEVDKFLSTSSFYRPDIDGLRAVSIVSVVAFHVEPAFLKGGFTGVDIFFVISGYLISRIILGEMRQGEFSLVSFYLRRARRIFPALAVVLATCLAVGYFILLPNEFEQLGKHTLAAATFLINFVLLGEIGYFDAQADLKPLLHLWSLSVEEQYYLVWPLFCVLFFGRRLIFHSVFFAVLIASFLASVYFTTNDPSAAFFLPFTRFWELAVGAALAIVLPGRFGAVMNYRILADVFAATGLVLCVSGFLLIDKTQEFPGYWALLPTCGAFLIIASGANSYICRYLLGNKVMVFVGLISYPLYLWHWPLLSFLRISEGTFREVALEPRLWAVVASVALATLTYFFVEKPLRYGGHLIRKALALTGAIMAAGAIGSVVFLTGGMPSRTEIRPAGAEVLTQWYPHPQHNENCELQYPEKVGYWSCLVSKNEPAQVILFGDSHAHQYYQALASIYPERSVLNISAPSCFPFSANGKKCRRKLEELGEFVTTNTSLKEVYITGYFSYLSAGSFLHGNIEGRRVAAELSEEAKTSFQENATQILTLLRDKDLPTTLLLDIPDVIFKPINCIRTSSEIMNRVRFSDQDDVLTPESCFIDEAEYRTRNEPYETALAEVLEQFPEVRVLDPRKILCDGQRCWVVKDGTALYWNSDHLTVEGADLVLGGLLGDG